ncbi:hypothetical protein [Hymenobacter wooponensis]|uniref:Uncharacterized protein n=1 Tax=Hymenobacter wooponensis TaxID=1525360 RepID=A0A4Z0MPS6_9BACT|nr:hypothetical protein [Hymenobacter wooponensis]TGD81247.1 hypothetical protein EU557_06690 [Hymenobacter wooponensis]
MKKVSLLLSFVLATSAAYAQQSIPKYLMLVREGAEVSNTTSYPSLTVIEPDGSFKTEEFRLFGWTVPKKTVNASITQAAAIDSSSLTQRRARYTRNLVYQAEIKKINELSSNGWVLINTLQEGTTVKYMFRKEFPVKDAAMVK